MKLLVSVLMSLYSRIMKFTSADEFYVMMGAVTQDLLDNKIICADELLKVRLVISIMKCFT